MRRGPARNSRIIDFRRYCGQTAAIIASINHNLRDTNGGQILSLKLMPLLNPSSLGFLRRRFRRSDIQPTERQPEGPDSPFDVFLDATAQRINRARLEHLASLGLDLDGKRILEVGAGIGLQTEFFERRGCDILSTDDAPANVVEMMQRWPRRKVGVLDLERTGDLRTLGSFDIVFCYGMLHHLRHPDAALAQLAAVCTGMILVETVVSRGMYPEINRVEEPPSANQAAPGIGCRPTRPWVMSALRQHFGYAYTTLAQPDDPDFVTDWSVIGHYGNLRAVFVGSRQKLSYPTLTPTLPIRHRNAAPRPRQRLDRRIWIDVGAHLGEHTRAPARNDPELSVHAFEPLPTLFAELSSGPPNYHVYAAAVGEQDGMAAFHINRFDAASSLLSMDEAVRTKWQGGDELGEERVIQVPVTRLDSFMRQHNISRVEFLKIDAQGADLAVLRSAGERLSDVDRIQLEVAVTPAQLYQGAADKAAILAFMQQHGFRLAKTELQSHDQEENLTFVRSDLPDEPSPPYATEASGQPVTGLYDFARAETAHGQIEHEDGTLALVTDKQQWYYTAIIPVGERAEDAADARFQLDLSVQVTEGAVQIGVLDPETNEFPGAATVELCPGWLPITLFTPPLSRAGPLIIRNASNAGRSQARCRMLAVTKLAALPATEFADAPPPAEESQALAEQFQASAEVLAQIMTAAPQAVGAVATIVAEAASRLRPALARGGQALIGSHVAAIETIFAELSNDQLSQIASVLARGPQSGLVPGWRSDRFLEGGDLATFIRYAIWLAALQRSDVPHVIVPWHCGTSLGLSFRDDICLAAFVAACFEPNETVLLDTILQPGMTVLDAVAAEGAYSLFFAAKVGRDGRVLAVEQQTRKAERLKANLSLNDLPQISVVAADQPILSIDDLAETQQLSGLDVIRFNPNSAEQSALNGARRSLKRWRPLLLFHAEQRTPGQQGGSIEELQYILKESGYRVLQIDPATGRPVPAPDYLLTGSLAAVHAERGWGLPVE